MPKNTGKAVMQEKLPEGWELVKYYEGSTHAIIKIRVDDIEKIRLVKLPPDVREYLKQKQRRYREKQKQKRVRP